MRREPRAATVGAFNASDSWKSGSRVPWSARDGGRIAGNAERETRNGSLAPLRYNTRAPMTCICISPSRCLVIIAMGPLASCCYPGSPLLSGRSAHSSSRRRRETISSHTDGQRTRDATRDNNIVTLSLRARVPGALFSLLSPQPASIEAPVNYLAISTRASRGMPSDDSSRAFPRLGEVVLTEIADSRSRR